MIKKADIILFIIILAVGLAVTVLPLTRTLNDPEVKVTVNGETYGVYPLSEDRTVEILQNTSDGAGAMKNVLVIRDGKCFMESASCHNQICVNHGPISGRGQVIVCLPNKVVCEIVGGGDVDVVSG
ncbi:MAG: NusG domain II-containing protein [Clostridia bacterium]|nr:NusG domain II-containing protein [Clostridia bacterium]